MLAYYYQVLANKKSKNEGDIANYYNNLLGSASAPPDDPFSRCIVCLEKGRSSISAQVNAEEIMEALNLFGYINMTNNKLLCSLCYKFITQAISFRKIAIRSQEILKSQETKLQIEANKKSDDEDKNVVRTTIQFIKQESGGKIVTTTRNIKISNERTNRNAKEQCRICNEHLPSRLMEQHQLLHDPDGKNYICHVCGKSFVRKIAYYHHSYTHRTNFAYKCELCPYRGQHSQLLKSHMLSHTPDYKYTCTECPAKYKMLSNYRAHMLRHKVPQFECDKCKKAYYTRAQLGKHYKFQHLGIRSHVCDVCGKAYGCRKDMLKHQLQIHNREKTSNGRMPTYLKPEFNKNK